jgi:Tol biopolymer transport system component
VTPSATNTPSATPTGTLTPTETPQPPRLEASGVCANGTVTFNVQNTGGPLQTAYTYTVTNGAGTVVASGNLPANGLATITVQNQAGQTNELRINNGQTVLVLGSASCEPGPTPTPTATPPAAPTATPVSSVSVSGVCSNGTVTFTVNTNGVSGLTFLATNSKGQLIGTGPVPSNGIVTITGQMGQKVTILISSGGKAVATSNVTCEPPGPPPTQVVCTEVTREVGGFPIVSMVGPKCPIDNTKVPRPAWKPITVGPKVCEDWLVYHTDKSGPNIWDVYRLGAIPGTGNTPENLTKSIANTDSIAPALSPDRRTIAFASDRDGHWEIYLASTDGQGQPQRATYNTFAANLDPVWSPDGRFIIYESVRRGNFDLYLMDVTIGPDSEVQLTNNAANEVNPYFAPDGKHVYYESMQDGKSQIYMIDLTDLNNLKTTKISDGKGEDFNPTVSPNGDKLAYRSYRDGTRVGQLIVSNADGSNSKPLGDTSATATNHSWSPSGKYIAYQSNVGGVMSVYVAEVETGKVRLATDKVMADNKDAINYAPTWYCKSDDTLVFTSDVTGSSNLFSIPALPIDAPPVKVDVAATNLTNGKVTERNQYPENSPSEEDASTLGLLPFSQKR